MLGSSRAYSHRHLTSPVHLNWLKHFINRQLCKQMTHLYHLHAGLLRSTLARAPDKFGLYFLFGFEEKKITNFGFQKMYRYNSFRFCHLFTGNYKYFMVYFCSALINLVLCCVRTIIVRENDRGVKYSVSCVAKQILSETSKTGRKMEGA